MEDYTEKKLRTINGYRGVIVDVTLDTISLPNGDTSFREIVRHPGGVTVLAIDEEGCTFCVRQFRYAFSRHLIELPAGKLEKGEDPFEAAKRELSEETGLVADEWTDLGSIVSSPGFTDEVLYMYMARGLHRGEAHPDDDEFLDTIRIPVSELREKILRNEISDGKTVACVLKGCAVLEGMGE